ncbi:hypothetical protein ACI2KR_08460 [Pseudomonas luteola]
MDIERLFIEWFALQAQTETVAIKCHHEKDPEARKDLEHQFYILCYRSWTVGNAIQKKIYSQHTKETILNACFHIEIPIPDESVYLQARDKIDRFLRFRIAQLGDKAALGYEFTFLDPHLGLKLYVDKNCVRSLNYAQSLHKQIIELGDALGLGVLKYNSVLKNAHPHRWAHYGLPRFDNDAAVARNIAYKTA